MPEFPSYTNATSLGGADSWLILQGGVTKEITATVMQESIFNSPTIVTPTIASFANATHSHQNAAGGGNLAIAATTGLQAALDAKLTQAVADGLYSALGHNHTGTYQPLDSDLTAFAALTPSNDDFAQRKAGAWANRTVAQVMADLGLSGTNTGDQDLSGYSLTSHNHSGVYQPLDADLTTIAGLAAPGSDKLLFWDHSALAYAYLTLGTNLSITGTTLDAVGGGAWGDITGTLGDQTDLAAALALKAPLATPTFTGQVITPVGSVGTPGITFAGMSGLNGSGLYATVSGDIIAVKSGINRLMLDVNNGTLRLPNNAFLFFTNTDNDATATPDSSLRKAATGVLTACGSGHTNYSGWFVDAGNKRASSDFPKTNTTLANITGLSASLQANRTYFFHACLPVDADATGGYKFAVQYSSTVSGIIYNVRAQNNADGSLPLTSREVALGGAAGAAGGTELFVEIFGTVSTTGAGDLTIQFAQNAANGTSSVLAGASIHVKDAP
jgi:hypothetical protein